MTQDDPVWACSGELHPLERTCGDVELWIYFSLLGIQHGMYTSSSSAQGAMLTEHLAYLTTASGSHARMMLVAMSVPIGESLAVVDTSFGYKQRPVRPKADIVGTFGLTSPREGR